MNADESLSPAAQQALAGLADITTPPEVSWMPQTWGWAALAMAVAVALAVWTWRRHHDALANRYRVEALAELSGIETMALDPQTRDAALLRLAELIKRTALAAYPRVEVAPLTGPVWVRFVREGGFVTDEAMARLLDDFEYRSPTARAAIAGDAAALLRATRTWIKEHRVPA